MKEVKFRWIDRLLINLTLREKFHILLWFPIAIMVCLSLILLHQNTEAKVTIAQQALTHKLDTAASLLLQAKDLPSVTLPAEIRLTSTGEVGTHRVEDNVTVTVPVGDKGYLSGTIALKDLGSSDQNSTAITVILLAVVLMGLVVFIVSRFIRSSILAINKSLKRLADGNLTERLNFLESRDEFSTLGKNIDILADRQQHILKLVRDSAEALEMFADEFREAAEDGQQTAQAQRQYLDSLATAMEEMTAAIREVARHANDTSEQTRQSSQEATQGAASVNRTIDAIQTLADEITEASSAVEQLTSRANKINEVVTVINSISGQTNLLALNAAIEAARAGEQGRGFAVVADEVRTLAGRTQQATVEIQHMIEELQQGTTSLNQIMDKTVHRAASSRELITGVGQDIERIANYTESIYEMGTHIATAAEQQSSVASEISQNLEEVREQSMKVEDSTEATVAGTQNLKVTASELDRLLSGMKF